MTGPDGTPVALDRREDDPDTVENDLDEMFAAIAHPRRRDILDLLLGEDDVSITETARLLEIDRFAASHHLGVLRAAGLTSRTISGAVRLQRLELDPMERIFDWLLPFIDASDSRRVQAPDVGRPRPNPLRH